MRPFYEIKAEIKEAKTRKANIEKELPNVRYKSITLDAGEGVKALLFGIIFAAIVFLLTGVILTVHDGIGFGLILVMIIALVFFVLMMKGIVGYVKGIIGTAAAGTFAVFSLPLLLIACYAFASGSSSANVLENVFPSLDVRIAAALGQPLKAFYPTVEYSGAALFIPSFLVFISSIVKIIRQSVKKAKVNKRAKQMSDDIQFLNTKIATLDKEYQDVRREAEQQFHEEIQKPVPDIDSIKRLESIGLEDAHEWLQQKERDVDRAESILIYERERKKKQPDVDNMKKAAGMGNPDANLWMAKRIILTYAAELNIYTKPELREAFTELHTYADKASESSDKDALFLTEAIAKLMYFVYCDYKASISQSEMLATLKRIRALKAENSLPPEDQPLVGIALDAYIKAVDLQDEMKDEKPQTSNRIYDPEQWDRKYVRANADFCVAWCDELNDKIISALYQNHHTKAKNLFSQLTDGLMKLREVLYGTEAISAYSYFSFGVFIICCDLPYAEEDKLMLAEDYFDLAQELAGEAHEYRLQHFCKSGMDLCDGSFSTREFRNTVCPHFPDDLIGGFLIKQSPRFEALWNDVNDGTALK